MDTLPHCPILWTKSKSEWLNSWEKSRQVGIQTNSHWCFTGGKLGVWEYVGWAWEVQAEGCDQGEQTGKGGCYGESLSRTWVTPKSSALLGNNIREDFMLLGTLSWNSFKWWWEVLQKIEILAWVTGFNCDFVLDQVVSQLFNSLTLVWFTFKNNLELISQLFLQYCHFHS